MDDGGRCGCHKVCAVADLLVDITETYFFAIASKADFGVECPCISKHSDKSRRYVYRNLLFTHLDDG